MRRTIPERIKSTLQASRPESLLVDRHWQFCRTPLQIDSLTGLVLDNVQHSVVQVSVIPWPHVPNTSC